MEDEAIIDDMLAGLANDSGEEFDLGGGLDGADDVSEDTKLEVPKPSKEKEVTEVSKPTTEFDNGFTVLPIIEDVLDTLGIEYDDTSFSDLDLTDPKSITSVIEQIIADKSSANFASPIAKDFNDYVAEGGDPTKFFENYTHIPKYADLDLDDESNLRNIAIEYNKSIGMSNEDAEEVAQDLIDSDSIKKLAPKYAKTLDSNNAKVADMREKQLEDARKADEAFYYEQLEKQRNLIENIDELAGIPFKNKSDKSSFIKYIQDVDPKTGKTKYEQSFIDDPTLRLKLQMLTYKGVDKDKIVAYADSKVAEKTKANLLKFANYTTAKRTAGKQRSGDFSPEDFVL